MTISEILQNVTILKDCTSINSIAAMLMVLGPLVAVGYIVIFFIGFSESSVKGKIGAIVVAVLCALSGAFNGWFYLKRPAFIDFYISANDVEIQQITKYFNVSEINETDDTLVCHIEPKSEFYDVVMTYWAEML